MGLPETVERKPAVFEHSEYAGISLEQIEAAEALSEFQAYLITRGMKEDPQTKALQKYALAKLKVAVQEAQTLDINKVLTTPAQSAAFAGVKQPIAIPWDAVTAAIEIAEGKLTRPLPPRQ